MSSRAAKKTVLSSGVIPVYRAANGAQPQVLLLRIYHYWDFPKGIVLPGEDPLQGALRELWEETTVDAVKFPWGQDYYETEPYSYGKIARFYIGEVATQKCEIPINPEIGRAEHHEFRWVSFEEARKLLVPRLQSVLDWAGSIISGSTSGSASGLPRRPVIHPAKPSGAA